MLEQPSPYAVSYGVVTGVAAAGTRRLVVRVDGKVVRDLPLRRRRFAVRLDLPLRETTVQVVTVDGRGRRARTSVSHVQGLPRAAQPAVRALRLHEPLARVLRQLGGAYRGSAGLYVADLTSGKGAAWNAQAQYPAASTLKVGIAVVALAAAEGVPASGTRLDGLLRRMLLRSDNVAANEVERWVGGSTSGGSARVNAMMRGIGLTHSDMYGGYIPEPSSLGPAGRLVASRALIPLRAEDQPSWGVGKRTTAYDLASLLRAIWLASGAKGPLAATQPGFTAADARYLLYLLARVHDPGKLDRFVRGDPGVAILHKAGWVDAARHDAGLVVWSGGILVAGVMTYRQAGVGAVEDALAGRTVVAALRAFRG